MRKSTLPLLALAGMLFVGGCCLFRQPDPAENFTVHKVYGDYMVLQCDRPIKISGTAEPGKAVKVTIDDNSTVATADENGEWIATLPAMEPGGPYTVTVTGKDDKGVAFEDVLIGEVWMCSGQSNMEMPVSSTGQFWRVLGHEREVANANYPQIRLFNTAARKSVAPMGPVKEIAGPGWVVCSPDTVGPFSAAGYFFGRQIHQDLKVPVGLINSSWGGTPIESWISEQGYRSAGRTKELLQIDAIKMSPEEFQKAAAELRAKSQKEFSDWENRFFSTYAAESAAAADWKNADFNDSDWGKAEVPSVLPGDYDGVGWYRTTVNIPEAWAGKALVLKLGAVDDCDETYFNGEKIGATGTDTKQYWSVERAYPIAGDKVKPGKAVIAVRVIDMFATGGILGPKVSLALQDDPKTAINLAGQWKYKVEFKADLAKIGARPAPPDDVNVGSSSPAFPSTLYNSMIAPWTVYPIRGAIWYQGEANAGAYVDYMTLHPLLIADWRERWDNPDLAFIFVQLAPFESHQPDRRLPDDFWKAREPEDPSWAKLREVQTATLKVPNTGMAVCIDAGDHSDIHPANKQVVGFRLAREAERICYGREGVSAGPLYDKMEIEGDRIRVHFTNVGSGLKTKNSPMVQSFAIAGKDGKFVWATAKIDGDTVVVWSDQVKEPTAVRYAWANYPGNPNLFNEEGFPASPFRTDQPDYLLK